MCHEYPGRDYRDGVRSRPRRRRRRRCRHHHHQLSFYILFTRCKLKTCVCVCAVRCGCRCMSYICRERHRTIASICRTSVEDHHAITQPATETDGSETERRDRKTSLLPKHPPPPPPNLCFPTPVPPLRHSHASRTLCNRRELHQSTQLSVKTSACTPALTEIARIIPLAASLVHGGWGWGEGVLFSIRARARQRRKYIST